MPTELICGGKNGSDSVPRPTRITPQNPPETLGTVLGTQSMFLSRMAPASARGFRIALDNIAGIISNGTKDCYQLNWAGPSYGNTARAREGLAAGYATRTVTMASAPEGCPEGMLATGAGQP